MRNGFGKLGLLTLIFLILLSPSHKLKAQDESASTTQLWLFWHHNHTLTQRLRYIGDIGYRQELPYENWIRMNFKPGIQWSAESIVDLAGGIGFYYTTQKVLPNSFELRPWQGVKVHWPSLGRFYFDHTARLEQRFNRSLGNFEHWSSVIRARYRLNLVFPINHNGITDKTFYTRINAEFFWNMGRSIEERYVNKNRYAMGFGYRFNPKLRLEMYYLAEQSRAFSEEGFRVNSHIIQVSLRTYILKDS